MGADLLQIIDSLSRNTFLVGGLGSHQQYVRVADDTYVYPKTVFGIFLTQFGFGIRLFVEVSPHGGGYGRFTVRLVGVFRSDRVADAPAEIKQGGIFAGVTGLECLA